MTFSLCAVKVEGEVHLKVPRAVTQTTLKHIKNLGNEIRGVCYAQGPEFTERQRVNDGRTILEPQQFQVAANFSQAVFLPHEGSCGGRGDQAVGA